MQNILRSEVKTVSEWALNIPLRNLWQYFIISFIWDVHRHNHWGSLCWNDLANYILPNSLANDFPLTIAIWPLAGYNASYVWQIKPQAKPNVSFTFILLAFVHKTNDFSFIPKFGWGGQIFLNQAQCFRFVSACWLLRYLENMSTTSIRIQQYFYAWFAYNINKGILTLLKRPECR